MWAWVTYRGGGEGSVQPSYMEPRPRKLDKGTGSGMASQREDKNFGRWGVHLRRRLNASKEPTVKRIYIFKELILSLRDTNRKKTVDGIKA